jgi:hypothetical protein
MSSFFSELTDEFVSKLRRGLAGPSKDLEAKRGLFFL